MSRLKHKGRWKETLSGNVLALGIVSFFTDIASEMIQPFLPVFFAGLMPATTAVIYIGLMDGLAESASSLLKIYSGRLSDALGKRKSLALLGYSISSLARPLVAWAGTGWHVVALRFIERAGKGIRTSPRDALISDSVDMDVRGFAFSFHRLMDHGGAVTGSLAAALFLYMVLGTSLLWQKGGGATTGKEMQALRSLFAFALVPGLGATLILWRWVREAPRHRVSDDRKAQSTQHAKSRVLPPKFFVFLVSMTLFTLGNSSDLFLVFYAQTKFGLGLGYVIALWASLHLSKIAFSLPGGHLSDRKGRRPAIICGWMIYILVYLAMPFARSLWVVWVLILVYGAYYGMTEGAERALVADFVPVVQRGKAYGLYHGAVGLAALPASVLFGLLWAKCGPTVAFFTGAALAALATLLLAGLVSTGKEGSKESRHG
ncbi:MFS transporter [Desulfohalobiaceae bacterium Ax17]|uniref:MFS transporter n=1 Tax=Desulfovulcanus ferrireducens TaxID=2831190 RepID=UPI00207BB90F|nr:MFS transporter [Desulfovulcanus ferrireducens]MBT8764321.1 MFS transporter [Desulfovulcanus ferrireducens]